MIDILSCALGFSDSLWSRTMGLQQGREREVSRTIRLADHGASTSSKALRFDTKAQRGSLLIHSPPLVTDVAS